MHRYESRKLTVEVYEVRDEVQFYLISLVSSPHVDASKAIARYNDFQDFFQQISLFYESSVPFPKATLFFSSNTGAKVVERGVKLQAWLKGDNSLSLFCSSAVLFFKVLSTRDYLVAGFLSSLQRKYDWDERNEISPKTLTSPSDTANYNSASISLILLNSNHKQVHVNESDGSGVFSMEGLVPTLEVLQKPNPLYICTPDGVFKYDSVKKRMNKTSECSSDSAPHCYANMSLVYQSGASNRLRLLYFPWKLDVDIAKVSSVFKNAGPKTYWQVAAVGETGRKVWIQDGKSAFIFDLESASWSTIPNFPNVHKESTTAIVVVERFVHVLSIHAHVKYNSLTRKWKTLARPQKIAQDNRRHNCGAIAARGYIFFYTGNQMARFHLVELRWESINHFPGREIHLCTWDGANSIYVWTLASLLDSRLQPRGFVYSINSNKWAEDESICRPVISSAFCTGDFDTPYCDPEYATLLLHKYWLVGQGPWESLYKNEQIKEDIKNAMVALESIPFSERVQYVRQNQATVLPMLEKALDLVLPYRTLVLIFQLLHEDPTLSDILLPITKQYRNHFNLNPDGSFWFTLKPERSSHFGLAFASNSSTKMLPPSSSPSSPSPSSSSPSFTSSSPSQSVPASSNSPQRKSALSISTYATYVSQCNTVSSSSSPSPSPHYINTSFANPTVLIPSSPTSDGPVTSVLPPPTLPPLTGSIPLPPLPIANPFTSPRTLPAIQTSPTRHTPPSPSKFSLSPSKFSPASSSPSASSPISPNTSSPTPLSPSSPNVSISSLSSPISSSPSPVTLSPAPYSSPSEHSNSFLPILSPSGKALGVADLDRHRIIKKLRDKNIEIPDHFICPITKCIMFEPVVAEDGHSYEKVALQKWFASGNVISPKTNEILASTSMFPCHFAKTTISTFLDTVLFHTSNMPKVSKEKKINVQSWNEPV